MPTITLHDAVKIPAEVLYHAIGEETALLHLDSGLYYGLDPVGSRVWQLLAEHGRLQTVYETMMEEYAIAPEVLAQDLLRLLQDLQGHRLVAVAPA